MKEFKKFISRGNVIDMAVGLVLATYFGAIIKSLVNDIIMPPVGQLLGGVDFSEMKYIIQPASEDSAGGAEAVAKVAIYYGKLINTIITFVIVEFAIFIVVKYYNKMKEKMEKEEAEEPSTPPAPSNEEVLLTEIRDLLKK